MWKWIGGVALFLVVLLMSGVCYGVKKMKQFAGDDGPATTMVGASVDRVFASLATGDSIPEWMGVSGTVHASRGGALKVGDSLTVLAPTAAGDRQRAGWIVTEVVPGRLLVLEMRNDSLGVVMASRRYALEVRADSTAIISTVAAPMLDSMKSSGGDSSTGGAMMTFASKMMLTGLRAQAKVELMQLKARLEGRSVPAGAQP